MDKILGEEELKGLEEEIDNAVDRLFIDNKKGGPKAVSAETPDLGPSVTPPPPKNSQTPEPTPVKPADLEPFMVPPSMKSSIEEASAAPAMLQPSMKPPELEPSMQTSLLEPSPRFGLENRLSGDHFAPHPSSAPVVFPKSVENMEAQLLSLEWEITQEKLQKTREEVLALQDVLKQKPDMSSLLSYMVEVLNHMIKNEESIRPPWIKFLLDSKETLKLLMRKETEGEINTYKQLAHLGIEARFTCLEGLKNMTTVEPQPRKEKEAEGSGGFISEEKRIVDSSADKKIEEMSVKMNLFMEKAEEIFKTMRQQVLKMDDMSAKSPVPSVQPVSKPVNVTVFNVDKKLFGVESQKVFKVFKVPGSYLEKYPTGQKIRLRDIEVKIVDLRKIFSISGGERTREIRILTVKDHAEYKGLVVDEVVNKSSALLDEKGKSGEYFLGVIHSTYQGRPVEIPLLDLRKF